MKAVVSALMLVAIMLVVGASGFKLARWMRGRPAPVAATAPVSDLIGKVAPKLALKGLNGETIDLASFRGRTVLLNFWASWCGPCVEEMPVLDRFARLDPGETVVIGVAVENHDDARAYLALHPVSYRIALGSPDSPDESAAFGNRMSVLPYSVLIDIHGVVRRAEARKFEEGDLDAWVNWQQR